MPGDTGLCTVAERDRIWSCPGISRRRRLRRRPTCGRGRLSHPVERDGQNALVIMGSSREVSDEESVVALRRSADWFGVIHFLPGVRDVAFLLDEVHVFERVECITNRPLGK